MSRTVQIIPDEDLIDFRKEQCPDKALVQAFFSAIDPRFKRYTVIFRSTDTLIDGDF